MTQPLLSIRSANPTTDNAKANDKRWRLDVGGLLGRSRALHAGYEADVSYCAPLGEGFCLDAGAGLRNTFSGGPYFEKDYIYTGADGGVHVRSGTYEFTFTPNLRLGLWGSVTKRLAFGIQGKIGYSLISGEYDHIQSNPPGVETVFYTDPGLFLGADLFKIKADVSDHFGVYGSAGIVKEPAPTRPDGTESQGGLGPETSLGAYLKF